MLSYVAGVQVELDEGERHAALRRAELLLAAGGDPRRALELYGRAVSSLARDLDSAEARAGLRRALAALATETASLAETDAARQQLLADPDLAWQCFAFALLAEALGE